MQCIGYPAIDHFVGLFFVSSYIVHIQYSLHAIVLWFSLYPLLSARKDNLDEFVI